jgi:hypothetical protein
MLIFVASRSSKTKMAKTKISIGLFILMIIFLTSPLVTMADSFGFSLGSNGSGSSFSLSVGSGSGGGWNSGALSSTGLPSGSIMGIIENIMFWLLGLLGIFGVIGFVISGILYLVSTGDDDRMGQAKKAMQYSIIGVIVGLIGVVVIQAINMMLNAVSNF